MHVALSALAGLVAGPVVHHVAVQAGADLPFAFSASVCRRCGARARLLNRCPSCGLGTTRPIVTSVATGVVAGLVAWSIGPRWVLGAYLWFVAMTVALFLTDIDHKRIPNRITYPGTPIGALLLAAGAAIDGTSTALPRALFGAVVFGGFFLLVFVLARGGFGFGDVKLAVLFGLFTAFLSWIHLFLAGMATAALGGIAALGALLGGAGAKSELPYGPPMILGAWASIVWGSALAGLIF